MFGGVHARLARFDERCSEVVGVERVRLAGLHEGALGVLAVADLVQDRADHHAGGEIAENRAEPQPLEDGRGEQRAAEHQEDLVVGAVGIGHAAGLSQEGTGSEGKKERSPLMPVPAHNKWGIKERPSHVTDDRFRKPSRARR